MTLSYAWEGQKVRLAPLERERHFENCVRWLNDPTVTAWTLGGDFPLTRLSEEEFFQRVGRGYLPEQTNEIAFAIELLDTEEHVGVTGIHKLNWRHGVGETGTLIGRSSLWGRGFGTDAIAVRSRYAFEVLGLRLLTSEVLSGNDRSLRALLHGGYREVGRIPERYWKRGAYRDAILLALARDDWRASVSQP